MSFARGIYMYICVYIPVSIYVYMHIVYIAALYASQRGTTMELSTLCVGVCMSERPESQGWLCGRGDGGGAQMCVCVANT